MFSKLGFGFLAVEYPGYGMSGVDGDGPGMGEGPTEAGILRAGEALLLHLEKAKGVSRDDMVLVGQSIGCAPALTLASRGFGRRLVLLSPFLSMSRMTSEVFPFLGPLLQLAPFFLFDKLDNAAAAKAFPQNVPVLIFHGTKDEVRF
jgi:pimeloyl-ACP methyl ester carboxylesterase